MLTIKKIVSTTSLFALSLLVCPTATVAQTNDADTYTNPVRSEDLPDPSVIYGGDGWFYVYTTNNANAGLPIHRSRDLVSWRVAGDGFRNGRPKWVKNAGIWAPEIAYVNGQYLVYYAMSEWGGTWSCGIGVASSPSPTGPFVDHGMLFISSEIGVENSIDACHFTDDDGKQYLFWGSFHGIYGIELDETGLKVKDGAEKFMIGPDDCNGVEGTMIFKRGRYYYFMASAGTCCNGDNSTYKVVVARSTNVKGPYRNKQGHGITRSEYPFTTILSGNDKVAGPGHNSEVIRDDNGDYWVLYHGYKKGESDIGRCLFLDQLKWDDNDWPYFEGGVPSETSKKPYFKNYIYTGIEDVATSEDDRFEIFGYKDNYYQLSAPANKTYRWAVYDLRGTLVEGGSATGEKDLWINELDDGMYIIEMSDGHQKVVKKVVKNGRD